MASGDDDCDARLENCQHHYVEPGAPAAADFRMRSAMHAPRSLSLARFLSLSLSLSRSLSWQPLGKGERLVCFVVNAHRVSLMRVHRACDVPQFSCGRCAEPEAVGNFHHGGAQSLRRPPVLASGVHRKRAEPETVGDFIMGLHSA